MKSRLRSDERWPDADLHGHFGLGQTGCRREWIAVIASLWTGRGRGRTWGDRALWLCGGQGREGWTGSTLKQCL